MMMGFVSGTTLFVEGKVDAQLLGALIGTTNLRVTISQEGDKYGLRNKVKTARKSESLGQSFFFLRDRDFDFEAQELAEPSPRAIHDQGWHWCRHEIENYLLEPEVLRRYVAAVTKREVTREEVQQAICDAAVQIRFYEASRWTIGNARQAGLPYPSDLTTRPDDVEEFRLPPSLGNQECLDWAVGNAKNFVQKVSGALDDTEVRKLFQSYEQMFTETHCKNVEWVLLHFSGKDLFAAMKPWFAEKGIDRNTKKFVEDDLTPWMSRNMAEVLAFLPEWKALLDLLREVQS